MFLCSIKKSMHIICYALSCTCIDLCIKLYKHYFYTTYYIYIHFYEYKVCDVQQFQYRIFLFLVPKTTFITLFLHLMLVCVCVSVCLSQHFNRCKTICNFTDTPMSLFNSNFAFNSIYKITLTLQPNILLGFFLLEMSLCDTFHLFFLNFYI